MDPHIPPAWAESPAPHFDPSAITSITQHVFFDFVSRQFQEIPGATYVELAFSRPTQSLVLDFIGEVKKVDCPDAQVAITDGAIRLQLPQPVAALSLAVSFVAKVNNSCNGFFLFEDDLFQCVASQAEPFGVVEMFPCLNQPFLRPSLHLHVRSEVYHVVLANTPLLSEVRDADPSLLPPCLASCSPWTQKGAKLSRFEPIDNIPIHLFCVLVGCLEGQFRSIAIKSIFPGALQTLPVGFYVNHGSRSRVFPGTEAVFWDRIEFGINFLVSYFRIPFPYKKLDLAFINSSLGAMENPGLITIRLQYLEFAVPHGYSYLSRQRMLFHELCHTYIGNMVSIHSFPDVWWKESLTEFLSYKTNAAYTEFLCQKSPEQWARHRIFLFGKYLTMLHDLLLNPHPIWPAEFDPHKMYSDTVYFKGTHCFRVLEGMLGESWLAGFIQKFVAKYQWKAVTGNALMAEFWEHFEDTRDTLVPELMSKSPGVQERDAEGLIVSAFDYMFRSDKLVKFVLKKSPKGPEFVLDCLEGDKEVIYLELVHYSAEGKELGRHQAILDLARQQTVAPSFQLGPSDLVLVDCRTSGHFLCSYEPPVFERLITQRMLRQIEDPFMRLSVYLMVKVPLHPSLDYLHQFLAPAEDLKDSETEFIFGNLRKIYPAFI